ncbi:hypothetical protein RB653_004695 [Dictyostelium firmibasis]|uniref:Major facilitator superfamily (MFS) profile domain-containing protein n=1 Tax=Dictyostelium firmibasis TaxID=79012 RepID=A0AAN7U871_9MYCE
MEIIEIRAGNNLNDLIISIIRKWKKENEIFIEIKNVLLSSSTVSTKADYFNEIKRFSFIEYQIYFNNKKNEKIFTELLPNHTNNRIILFFGNGSRSQNQKKESSIIKFKNNNNNFKKVNIVSIMIENEKIIGEDEPLLVNENINISTTTINSNNNNDDNNNNINSSKLSIFLLFNVSFSVLSTLQFGYNTGVISPTILDIQTIFGLTINEKSMLVTSVLFGAMVGSFISGIFVDIFGRKKTLLGNNIFYLLGPLLCSIGKNYATLLVGRLITGIGVGIASSVVPLYITEISPPSFRGSLGLLRQSTVTLGIMLSSLFAYGLLVYSNGWRYTFAIASIPSIFQFSLSYWFVETPRWLISKNREVEAREIMKKIEPHIDDQLIENQIIRIRQSVLEQKGNDSWIQLFNYQYLKIYVIGFGLNMLQQFVGINCVIYYSGIILEDAGFAKNPAVLIGALVGIPQLIMLLISVWLIDRFGRKPLLLYGCIGMVIGLAVLGYPFYHNSNPIGKIDSTKKGWIAVAGMIFFKLMFSMGLGPIPALVGSEIFPSKIRGKAMAISQLLNWAANCIVNSMYLHMVNSKLGQSGTFWFFGGISVITFFFVLILVPETKNVQIEELSKRLILKKK